MDCTRTTSSTSAGLSSATSSWRLWNRERWETSLYRSLIGCSVIQATSWPTRAAKKMTLFKSRLQRLIATSNLNPTSCLDTGLPLLIL
eukprot:4041376-Pyramimonas_sp.AAC.1